MSFFSRSFLTVLAVMAFFSTAAHAIDKWSDDPKDLNSMNKFVRDSMCHDQSHFSRGQENSVKFEPVFIDKSNDLKWSRALPVAYTNGCIDKNGKIDYSKCTREKDGEFAILKSKDF